MAEQNNNTSSEIQKKNDHLIQLLLSVNETWETNYRVDMPNALLSSRCAWGLASWSQILTITYEWVKSVTNWVSPGK
jgi:hypothetical protein